MQMDWIYVKEKMPSGIWHVKGCSGQRLLVSVETGANSVNYSQEAVYMDDEKAFHIRDFKGGLIDITDNVSAWMPLPNAAPELSKT